MMTGWPRVLLTTVTCAEAGGRTRVRRPKAERRNRWQGRGRRPILVGMKDEQQSGPDATGDGGPYEDALLRRILNGTRTVACVGVSTNPIRPSYFVARYLGLRGIRVLPVNPAYAGQTLFGEVVCASLSDIPGDVRVDMVDIFRRSDQVPPVVDEAIAVLAPRGLATIWMQIGVINHEAAARARAAGLTGGLNRCPKIEYPRLCGELSMGGFNSGRLSSKL